MPLFNPTGYPRLETDGSLHSDNENFSVNFRGTFLGMNRADVLEEFFPEYLAAQGTKQDDGFE